MAQLIPGDFGSKLHPKVGPFGLAYGQMHSGNDRIIKNAGWYNSQGEKIGSGDLLIVEMRKIAEEIDEAEAFVILHELDSNWNDATADGGKAGLNVESPGIDYIAKHAQYAILKNFVYLVDDSTTQPQEVLGVIFPVMTRGELRATMEAFANA